MEISSTASGRQIWGNLQWLPFEDAFDSEAHIKNPRSQRYVTPPIRSARYSCQLSRTFGAIARALAPVYTGCFSTPSEGSLDVSTPSAVIASGAGAVLGTGACNRCAEGSEIVRTGTERVFSVRNLLFRQPLNLSIHRCILI